MSGRLRVVHRPAGYEAWKDEKTIARPNVRVIVAVIATMFICGAISGATGIGFLSARFRETPAPPTLVSLSELITETPTHTQTRQPTVTPTVAPTQTALPTVTPILSATPDLQATLDHMLAQPTVTPVVKLAPPPEPIFCDGAPFENYTDSSVLVVTFQDKGALRLLDQPRLPGSNPDVIKQLYDGDQVVIQGDASCGSWNDQPVAYYPVFVPRWDLTGFVGFGQSDDVWLEPNRGPDEIKD
jgi:hypothetical protein